MHGAICFKQPLTRFPGRHWGGANAVNWASEAIAIAWLRFRLDLDQRPRNEVLLWCIAVAAKLARGIWQVHRKSACFVLVENVEVLAPCSRDILESEVLEAAMARLGPIDAACLGMFLGGANVQQIALARGVSLRSVRATCGRIREAITASEESFP